MVAHLGGGRSSATPRALATTIVFFAAGSLGGLALAGFLLTAEAVARVREVLGGSPPADGVDWLILTLWIVMVGLAVGSVLTGLAILNRRAIGRAELHGISPVRPRTLLLGHAGAEWEQSVAAANGLDAFDPPQVHAAVRERLSAVSVAAGLGVGISRNPVFDAAHLVAGFVQAQQEVAVALGLRLTVVDRLRVGWESVAGIWLVSAYDVEKRLEIETALRLAALGMEIGADGLDFTADAIDDLVDAMADLDGGGLLGLPLKALGLGAGASASMTNAVSEHAVDVGTRLAEGVVASTLIFRASSRRAASLLGVEEQSSAEVGDTGVPIEIWQQATFVARSSLLRLRSALSDRAKRLPTAAVQRGRERFRRTTGDDAELATPEPESAGPQRSREQPGGIRPEPKWTGDG